MQVRQRNFYFSVENFEDAGAIRFFFKMPSMGQHGINIKCLINLAFVQLTGTYTMKSQLIAN